MNDDVIACMEAVEESDLLKRTLCEQMQAIVEMGQRERSCRLKALADTFG
jgi:hypothetical protein